HNGIPNPVWGNDQNTLHEMYPDSAPIKRRGADAI
ncbi:MAG: hypothetical protein RI975_543, partial [Pseudomonadota bacterium]